MSKKHSLKPVVAMLGSAYIASLAFSSVANAETNPFSANDLTTGYMVAEGKCGEGMKKAEGKCGEGMKKAEGKCGEGMKKAEGKCGGKIGTGKKDPAVCGTFSAAKCSVGHLKK